MSINISALESAEKDKSGSKEFPICPLCFDDQEKIIHLQECRDSPPYHWACNKCRSTFAMPDSPPLDPIY